MCAHARAV